MSLAYRLPSPHPQLKGPDGDSGEELVTDTTPPDEEPQENSEEPQENSEDSMSDSDTDLEESMFGTGAGKDLSTLREENATRKFWAEVKKVFVLVAKTFANRSDGVDVITQVFLINHAMPCD